MTFAPIRLDPLDPQYVDELYKRAESQEAVFRNILVDVADDDDEANFFRSSSLDSIFDKHVRIEGYGTRVSDFRVGPFDDMVTPSHMFPEFKSRELKENNALVVIQRSNVNLLHLYEILENSTVKLVDHKNYHQF